MHSKAIMVGQKIFAGQLGVQIELAIPDRNLELPFNSSIGSLREFARPRFGSASPLLPAILGRV